MSSPGITFRSAAVARMAQLPVATLRIWEQRYGAVQPQQAPSGHRLYSAADVARVSILRQLTGLGHAIGSIAKLSTAELEGLYEARAGAPQPSQPIPPSGPLRLGLIGLPLSLRLQRPALAQRLMDGALVTTVYESPEVASAAATAGQFPPTDLLIAQVSEVRAQALDMWRELVASSKVKQVWLVYRYAVASVVAMYAKVGVHLVKEPPDDDAWVSLIRGRRAEPPPFAPSGQHAVTPADASPPRRYSDAALTAIAGLAPSMACQCPGHLAELLMQLAAFEAYSATCINDSPQDAELHAYLQATAAQCRALFETALERVSLYEGLDSG